MGLSWCSITQQVIETPNTDNDITIIQTEETLSWKVDLKVKLSENLYRNTQDKYLYYIESNNTVRKVSDIAFDEYLWWSYFRKGDTIYVHKYTIPLIWWEVLAISWADITSFKVYDKNYAYDNKGIYIDNIFTSKLWNTIDTIEVYDHGLLKINNIWCYYHNLNEQTIHVFDTLPQETQFITWSVLYNPVDNTIYSILDGKQLGKIDITNRKEIKDTTLPTDGKDWAYYYYSDNKHNIFRFTTSHFDGSLQNIENINNSIQ